jgi:DNA-binding transcriptional MerR regulator
MKIGELAKHSGLSAHTIRYYERIGLLPYAHRDHSNQRDYDASILAWIEFLGRLKTTGMPIREMLRYSALRQQGAGTEAGRREMLEQHRERVRAHVTELNACLLALDAKIGG